MEQVPASSLGIDNFKSVNDTLGHLGSDEVLKLLADTMKRGVW
ncbi:diguanylate cyclase domain-containing protein [Roseburia intestinalis]